MSAKNIRRVLKSSIAKTAVSPVFERLGLYYIDNRNIAIKAKQMYVYNTMKEKYKTVIENGVEPCAKAERSNKVWICWLQGEDAMPDLVRACVNSVRQNLPDREIIILSNDNLDEYIKFPEYIKEKRAKGIISHAHYSDLIRTELMCDHGGLWLDATVLCTSGDVPKSICDSDLFMFKAMDLSRRDINPTVASSWFIYAKSNQRIMLLTRELLHRYWQQEDKLADYFLFHIFFAIATVRYSEDWKRVPVFNNHSPHVLQFELAEPYNEVRWDEICNMSCFHKLNHHNDYSKTGDSFYKHILEKYLER